MTLSTDIIDRLARSLKPFWNYTQNDVIGDAMAEITNLRAERDAARVVDGTSYQKGLEMAAAVCDLPCRSLAGEMEAAAPMHARMIRSLSVTFGTDFSEDGPNETPAVIPHKGGTDD
jgi:hypothetical protein